jgi:acetyl esterase/lipase
MSRPGGMVATVLLALLMPHLRAADGAPKTYPIEKVFDVAYGKGGGEDLKLDYARPTEAGTFPGVLCIHGGGWAAGKRQDFQFLVERLAGQGYVAVTASYRFAPRCQFPAQIEDVKCAVRWMRAHAGMLKLDPARIGAIGASAGGHLACLLGSSDAGDHLDGTGGWPEASSRVQAVVNYFGPTDMTVGRFPDASSKILENFLGGSLEAHREEYRRASPVTYLTPDDPPVLTFQGTVDPLVPYEQAEILHRRLADLHILNRLVVLEGRGHGWGGADMERTIQDSIAFFDRCLKGRRVDRL